MQHEEPAAVSVRLATIEDLSAISELGAYVLTLHLQRHPEQFREPDSSAIADFFKSHIENDNSSLFVAIDQAGRIVGYALAVIETKPANPFKPAARFVELDQIAVDPSAQSNGTGTRLMESVIDFAHDQNVDDIQLSVWGFNERAISLYQRFGFEALHVRMFRSMNQTHDA